MSPNSARAELAERLADVDEAPRTLVLRLATDVIGVARPILERSPVLTDEDLSGIATTQSDDHRYAIGGRASLSAPLAEVLVSRGSARVLERVASNDGAELSPASLTTLVERSQGEAGLEVTLASRRDRGEAGFAALIPGLSDAVADRLAALGLDPGRRQALDLKDRLKRHLAETSRDLRDVVTIASRIKAGQMSLDECALRLARSRRSYDLGALFGMLADIPRQITIRTMQNRDAEPLLIVCRTLGLSWRSVEAILEMRAVRAHEPYAPSPATRRAYDALDAEAAERTVRLLRVRARAADPV